MPNIKPPKTPEELRRYKREWHRKRYHEDEDYRNRYIANNEAWRQRQLKNKIEVSHPNKSDAELDLLAARDLDQLRERRKQDGVQIYQQSPIRAFR